MAGSAENSHDSLNREILDAAHTAFIDKEFSSAIDYRPKFVSNDYKRGRKVSSALEAELAKCSSFDFSVAM